MNTVATCKVTEDNTTEVCKLMFDKLATDITPDLSLTVSQLMGYPIGVFKTAEEAEVLCANNNIPSVGFERLLCNIMILELVCKASSESKDLTNVPCEADCTMSICVQKVTNYLPIKAGGVRGIRVKSISYEDGKSIGEYNVSLVLKYLQSLIQELWDCKASDDTLIANALSMYSDLLSKRPSVYLSDFNADAPQQTLVGMVRSITDAIGQAHRLNAPYTISRLNVLALDIGTGHPKEVDSKIKGYMSNDLAKFFTTGKETTIYSIHFLLRIYAFVVLSAGDYELFENLRLEE
jgi:hypothetical protein